MNKLSGYEECSINCWYFGPANKSTDSYMMICSRSSGCSGYYAEWRYVFAENKFVLVVMDYDNTSHPKIIERTDSMSKVLHYIMTNIHPHEV